MELFLENGEYLIRRFDTYTGTFFKTERTEIKDRFIRIAPPEFTKDIALAIEKIK